MVAIYPHSYSPRADIVSGTNIPRLALKVSDIAILVEATESGCWRGLQRLARAV